MNWLPAMVGDACLPTFQADPARDGATTFRYVDIAGVDRDAKVIFRADEVPCVDAPSRARKVIRASDVLVSTVRPNLNAVALVPDDLDGEIASTGFSVLRADPTLLNAKFLFYWVQHREFVDFLVANATGASYPAVTDGVVKRARLPLATPKEQSRIVELLDEADRLRRLRRSADDKFSKVLPALFLKIFGQPDTWRHTEPLGRLVKMKSGGTPSKTVPEFWHGPIPWVSPKDMKRDEIDDSEDHISENALQESAAQLVPAGSVLIVVRGMILARDVPIAITGKPVTINQDMKALNLMDERLSPRFLFAALKVQSARLLSEVTTAAHGTKKLESGRIENLPIPIPSPSALARFSSAHEQLLAIDRHRAATGPRVEELFALMLQRAFSGRLTSKWREAYINELLAEMSQQARALNLPASLVATA